MRTVSICAAVGAAALAGFAPGCGKIKARERPLRAVAVIRPTEGNACRGVVRFEETSNGLLIIADVEGLSLNGTHGFHIHEFGDTTALDAKSAGGHYNPEGHPHAGPDTERRHAGDLGNLVANASGVAHYESTVTDLTVAGERNPAIGRAVVVHRDPDDLTSQPTGNAGPRIGVGVIGVARPTK
ncbi:MAG: superoxide dismutase family protein [Planctomycetota bacterium]|jgi:Cu-Zn family superoxide dismutase